MQDGSGASLDPNIPAAGLAVILRHPAVAAYLKQPGDLGTLADRQITRLLLQLLDGADRIAIPYNAGATIWDMTDPFLDRCISLSKPSCSF